MSDVVGFEQRGAVGVITIQRPEAMNALNAEVLSRLQEILSDLPKSVGCLVVTGSGNKAFVAGADIKQLDGLDEAGALEFAQTGQGVFRQIEKLHCPVIAAVNGFALGGGLELALSCDFILASEKAKLGLPEITLGIMPGFGGTVRLARAVGMNRCRQMVFTGEFIGAEQALNWGLVNQVHKPEELMDFATKMAEKIASLAPLAQAAMKESCQISYDQDVDTAMITEREAFAKLFNTEDQKEGTRAFIEKRTAQFRGN